MPKQELKTMSTRQLKKRQNFSAIVIGISFGLSLVLIIIGLTEANYTLLVIVLALLVTSLPMYLGLRKIKLELKNREGREEVSSSSD